MVWIEWLVCVCSDLIHTVLNGPYSKVNRWIQYHTVPLQYKYEFLCGLHYPYSSYIRIKKKFNVTWKIIGLLFWYGIHGTLQYPYDSYRAIIYSYDFLLTYLSYNGIQYITSFITFISSIILTGWYSRVILSAAWIYYSYDPRTLSKWCSH